MVLGIEKWFNITAVIILVISLLNVEGCSSAGFLRFTHNDDYASRGESSLWVNRKKTTKFANNMSYRLPYSKIISFMTNMITAVRMNHFSVPAL